MPRSAKRIECSKSVVKELQDLATDSTNPRMAVRASMVLACINGEPGKSIAERFSEREATVIKWKKRFLEHGVAGLKNLPRGDSGKMYGEPFRKQLLQLLESKPPDGKKYWTCKMLASALDAPQYVVTRYLRVEGIRLLDQRQSVSVPPSPSPVAPSPSADVLDADADVDADVDHSSEDTYVSLIPFTIRLEGHNMNNNSNEKYDIEVTVRIKSKTGDIIAENTSCNEGCVPNLTDFNMSTIEGFRTDFDTYEKSMIKARDEAVKQATEKYIGEVVKKNKI